jgi:hypothetical protein
MVGRQRIAHASGVREKSRVAEALQRTTRSPAGGLIAVSRKATSHAM